MPPTPPSDDERKYTDADVDRIVRKRLDEQAVRLRVDTVAEGVESLRHGQAEMLELFSRRQRAERSELKRRAQWEKDVTRRLDEGNHLRELLVTKAAFQAFVDGLPTMLAGMFVSYEDMDTLATDMIQKYGIVSGFDPEAMSLIKRGVERAEERARDRQAEARVLHRLARFLRLDELRKTSKLILVPFLAAIGYALANALVALSKMPGVEKIIHVVTHR